MTHIYFFGNKRYYSDSPTESAPIVGQAIILSGQRGIVYYVSDTVKTRQGPAVLVSVRSDGIKG